jgi:hypothetical protein
MRPTAPKRKPGRPPASTASDGSPELTSKFPKLSISIRPSTKSALAAVATLEGRAIWLIIEDSIHGYIAAMAKDDQKVIEALAHRMENR